MVNGDKSMVVFIAIFIYNEDKNGKNEDLFRI